MFLFKKIFSQFLFPLPLLLSFVLLGLFLLWFTRKQKLGKVLVSIAVLILLALSYGPVSNRLLVGIEREHKNFTLTAGGGQDIDCVVVLSGGYVSDPDLPLTGRLGAETLVRLVEGIRIYRQYPGSRLLVSGGAVYDPVPCAEAMAELAEQLGVSRADMIVETKSSDTKDQARIIKGIVEEAPFALVTSASHMPRSMAMFRALGMNPLPAPTGHKVKEKEYLTPGAFFPEAYHLRKAETAVYEYLGTLWAKLRGQI